MKNQLISITIVTIISGIVVAVLMHIFIGKPQVEKEKALILCDRINEILSETINNTQNSNENIKDFVANELNKDINDLMAYYDKTKDCEIGEKIKNYLNTLINMTNDNTQKIKLRKKISIIEIKCK